MIRVYWFKFVHFGPIVINFLVNTIGRCNKLNRKRQDNSFTHVIKGIIIYYISIVPIRQYKFYLYFNV